jgi:cysteinyl-tRNA synthetase
MKEEKITASKEIENMAKERNQLRKEKNWAESDIIRNRIKESGYNVIDTNEGFKLEKI